MSVRRFVHSLAAVLLVAACADQTGPTSAAVGSPSFETVAPDTLSHTLHQAATAPALETYQLTFWARRDKASDVRVDYLPAAGQKDGDRFLQFKIPDGSLVARPGGYPLHKRASVEITLTIDPVLLTVDFEPSGLIFSQGKPAKLTIWYGHADPDLNGDGVVDGTDWQLAEQIAIWLEGKRKVHRVRSENDWAHQVVTGKLHHFSQFAVSW